MKTQICKFCCEEFKNKKKRNYCSSNCYHKSQIGKKRVIRYCMNCNKIIKERHNKKFCCGRCYTNHPKSKETIEKMKFSHKNKSNNGQFKKGDHHSPGTEFKKGVYQGYGFKEGHKLSEELIAKKREIFRRLYKEGKLSICLSWNRGKTKDTDVRIIAGEKHSNWKGGITPLIHKRINSREWIKLSEKIRKRDNNTCQNPVCGKIGGNINLPVHHIIPFNISHCNETYNLITLCRRCHGIFEANIKKLGYKALQERLTKLYGYQYSDDKKIMMHKFLEGGKKNGNVL